MKSNAVSILKLALLALAAANARAWSQSLVVPISITHTGTAAEFFDTEDNLINDTGLSAPPTIADYQTITHDNAAAGNAWVTTNPNGAGDFYLGDTPPTVVFEMGFDQLYRFSDFVFWGYHFGSTNGNEGRRFELEFSNDGGVTFQAPVVVERALGSHAFRNAATLDLGADYDANFARLKVLDNHFGVGAGGDRVGLGEVRFIGDIVRDPWIGTTAVSASSGGTPIVVNFPITNRGALSNLNITAASFSGTDASRFTLTSVLPRIVGPGLTVNLTATFDPADNTGNLAAVLNVTTNDPVYPIMEVPVGIAVAIPNANYPASANFGPVAHGAPLQTFSVPVGNTGSSALGILEATFIDESLDPALLADFSVIHDFASGPLVVAPAATGNVSFSFDPTGLKGGVYPVNLKILTDDPDTPEFNVPVTVDLNIQAGSTLAGWWPLETDSRDASGNGFDGFVTTGSIDFTPAGASGTTGGSALFDGFSSIDVLFNESLNPSSYSVTLWANANEPLTGFNSAITSRYDGFAALSRTYGFILYRATADWEFWTGSGQTTTTPWAVTGTTPVIAGNWTHLAITYNHVTRVKTLYVNGVAASTTNGVVSGRNLLRDLHIGGGGDLGTSFGFNGKLDDVAIFREALDVAAINTILTNGVTGYTGLPLPAGESAGILITEVSLAGGNLVIGGTSGLVNGQPYHLQSSPTLNFISIPGSTFTGGNPVPPVPVSGPRLFIRITEGPAPIP